MAVTSPLDCPKVNFTQMPPEIFGGSAIGRAALQIAIKELKAGAKEIGANNSGAWVKKYLNGLAGEGSAWCAGFVCFCYSQSGCAMPFDYTVSARQLFNQFKSKKWQYQLIDSATPEPGDLVFWSRSDIKSWQGHVGLVHHGRDNWLFTIEGNRTRKVQGFGYDMDNLQNILGFGRVPDS